MRPSLTILLPSACLALAIAASPLAVHGDNDTLVPRASVSSISSIFQLDNGKGGCAGSTTQLNEWLAEVNLLHSALKTVQSYAQTDGASAIIWYKYFGVQPGMKDDESKALYSIVKDKISRVTEFLAGEGLVDPAKTGEMPRLFCGAGAGQTAEWDQPAMDVLGEQIPLEEDENGEVVEYVLLEKLFEDQVSSKYPFWMSSYNGYALSSRSRGAESLCPTSSSDDSVRVAVTSTKGDTVKATSWKTIEGTSAQFTLGSDNRHVLLCPIAFNPTGNSHAKETLAEVLADYPVPSVVGGSGKTYTIDSSKYLPELMSRSSTLYHELYHLTDDDDTPDAWYNLKDIIQSHTWGDRFISAVKKNQELLYNELKDKYGLESSNELFTELDEKVLNGRVSVRNPETYAFAAMAAYLYVYSPTDVTVPSVYLGHIPLPADKIFGYNTKVTS